MATGLFESLRKYRPREKHDPLENFITEAFAWLLNTQYEFKKDFLDFIAEDLSIDNVFNASEFQTQYNFNGKYPDMVCINDAYAIIFEHKAFSSLSNNQLENYREYAETHFTQYKVVLITANQYQHEQESDLTICWSDICKFIDIWLSTKSKPCFLFKDFTDFLKSEGLGPSKEIQVEAMRYYFASNTLHQDISELIGRVEKSSIWGELINNDHAIYVHEKRGHLKGESWGRIGFTILDGNYPGIFIGFLLDGRDHKTKPVNETLGPDMCLILDFDEEYHNRYPASSHYNVFIENVSKKIILCKDWELYNHIIDSTVDGRPNYYHPIHLRTPMLNVFQGTATPEEQDVAFCQAAKSVIQLAVNEQSFWDMRDEFKRDI